jgi:hypothetical protein
MSPPETSTPLPFSGCSITALNPNRANPKESGTARGTATDKGG